MKIVAYIPARMGSQRVPKKNLRLIAGKPLIAYSVEAAKKVSLFDEIYINSDGDIFGDLAKEYGVQFYKRPEVHASNAAINDAFTMDFIEKVQADVYVQLLPTSPLITPEEIVGFVKAMQDGKYETMVSVIDHKIASIYENKPVNFTLQEPHRPSQTMTPVQSYATVLMAWTRDSYLKNMREIGCGYHGGNSRIGYYRLSGFSTIDIDHEDEFALAEVALEYIKSGRQSKVEYWSPKAASTAAAVPAAETAETNVPSILSRDGVKQMGFAQENQMVVNLKDILNSADNSQSWCQRIINTESNSATLISQLPGEGNRLHYHPDWNEWWYIVSGEWKWEIEGREIKAREGDVILITKGLKHRITATGNKPAVRLAVSRDGMVHVYPEQKTCAAGGSK